MHICKKVILMVVGVVLPILVATAFMVDAWLIRQFETSQQQAKLSQQALIQATVRQAKAAFDNVTTLYAHAYQTRQTGQNKALPLNAGDAGINVYRYSPLQPDRFFELNTLESISSLNVVKQAVMQSQHELSGFLWHLDQALFVRLFPVSGSEYLVFAQALTSSDIQGWFVGTGIDEQAQLSPLPQATSIAAEKVVSQPLLTLLHTPKIYLHTAFSSAIAPALVMTSKWLPLGIVLFGLGMIAAVCLWLRKTLFVPFNKLNEQLDSVDPDAKIPTTIQLQGPKEVTNLAERFNFLLKTVSQHKERAKVTLEAINDAVIVTNLEAKICYFNPQAETLFDICNSRAFGCDLDMLVNSDSEFTPQMRQLLGRDDEQTLVSKVKLGTSPSKIVERSVSKLTGYQGEVIGCVTVIRDITQEELLKSQLKRRANYDVVTGLMNRSAFEHQLEAYVAGAKQLAVCYMDLEQFKLINDNCGHSAGDTMLALVATAMQKCLAGRGLLARLGGDEFGLILCDYSDKEVALLLKLLIHQVSSQVMHNDDCHHSVGISVGVALGKNTEASSTAELLKDADIACLAAKRKGNNQIHFYDDKDKELNYERNAPKWAVRIAQAIEHNELLLYYQPIKGLACHGQRKRLEILLRILEPSGKILPPAQFIAAAERFKLMTEVDKDVVRKAFLWLSLHEEIWDDHCISINLSGNSLGAEGMIEYIKEQQARFEIPSECICFEITETSAIQNQARAMDMLKQLRILGFAFALDDFGTGFASYGYLRELPVDYVKIDGCFIKSLANNAKDFAIVKSIHDVCISMGIETVAEFVENQDIITALQEIGINYAQGYAIGRPQALELYLPIRSAKRA